MYVRCCTESNKRQISDGVPKAGGFCGFNFEDCFACTSLAESKAELHKSNIQVVIIKFSIFSRYQKITVFHLEIIGSKLKAVVIQKVYPDKETILKVN